MTREEAIKQLKTQQSVHGDVESQHGYADCILCDLLTALGYEDVVHEYDLVPKWYA